MASFVKEVAKTLLDLTKHVTCPKREVSKFNLDLDRHAACSAEMNPARPCFHVSVGGPVQADKTESD